MCASKNRRSVRHDVVLTSIRFWEKILSFIYFGLIVFFWLMFCGCLGSKIVAPWVTFCGAAIGCFFRILKYGNVDGAFFKILHSI